YHSGDGTVSSGTIADSSPNRVLLSVIGEPRWQLVIRHRSGSVDAAVIRLHHRNLAISLIALLMLVVSLITILVTTRRAHRLAQLQMEFASGISHELRTPLAVIRSAAENLADGIVAEADRVRDYGTLIHKESQRLSGMVDHILDFAHLQAAAPYYQFATVAVTDILSRALASEKPRIQSSGMELDIDFADGLPLLFTDAATLSQCLQNLLSNAVKYGSDGGRIRVTATPAHEDGELRVLIAVQDFGNGIAPDELPHIYDPFYRGATVRELQIHGTGLGLSLTRKMMEDLNGRVTVKSSPGKGSTFTLHVPAFSGEAVAIPAVGASQSEISSQSEGSSQSG
ncbi:MAG: HAMP domain-containing sensor histidine kinase, partial [Acidobacteriaceae bacterium]